VITSSDADDYNFFAYTSVGKHSVVYKLPLAKISAPKVDEFAKIPVKDSFFAELEKRTEVTGVKK